VAARLSLPKELTMPAAPATLEPCLRMILAGLTVGRSQLPAAGDDARLQATVVAMRALGAHIVRHGDRWQVDGVGIGSALAPQDAIDCAGCADLAGLLVGAVAGTPITVTFVNAPGLLPAGLVAGLRVLGARMLGRDGTGLPLTLAGAPEALPLDMGVETLPEALALLLAALQAPGASRIEGPWPDWLADLLTDVGIEATCRDRLLVVRGWPELQVQG